MNFKNIASADFSKTGYSYTLSLISGKYKPVILYCLMEYEPVRFNEMQRYLGKVEYSLTERGAAPNFTVPPSDSSLRTPCKGCTPCRSPAFSNCR